MSNKEQPLHVKITSTCVFLLIIIVAGFQTTAFAQDGVFCPKEYDSEKRHIPLFDQQISRSSVISKAVCVYDSQNVSKTTFEISWSPSGKIQNNGWCVEKISIENGIGTYQSQTHYVKITASGIQPTETDYALDFMQELFLIVKDDSKSCTIDSEQILHQLEVQNKTLEIKSLSPENTTKTTHIENTTITIPILSNIQTEKVNQFPLEYLALVGILVTGLFVLKFKRKHLMGNVDTQ